jgi:uncharacterized protein (TIGR03905 family)
MGMKSYIFNTEKTCSKRISFDLDGDIVHNVKFLDGGCPGNLQAVPRLVEGLSIQEIEEKIGGIQCGIRGTSCADQLVRALKKAQNEK